MNTVYRIVWNTALGKWVVASEFAKRRGKAASSKVAACAVATALGAASLFYSPTSSAELSALFGDQNLNGNCVGTVVGGAGGANGWSSSSCDYLLGTITTTRMYNNPGLNLVSNANGLFADGGLEVFGNRIAAGNTVAYIHGQLSLFSGVGTTGNASKIIGLAAGDLNATSNDGVNGSQLFTTNTRLDTLKAQVDNSVGVVVQDPVTQAITVGSGTGGNSINVAGAIGDRTISGVKAGNVAAGSTEAVNGSQLNDTNTNVTNLTGRVSTVEGSVTNITNQLNTGTVGLVRQDPVTQAITVASATGGTSINVAGAVGNRTISGVAAGNVAAGSTEAVNGSQLNDTNTNVTNLGTTVGGIDSRVTQNTADITTANSNISNLTTSVQTIDGRVTTVEGSVTNITNELNAGTVGLVKQDAATKAITVAAATGGTSINVAGTDGNRTISGVAAGNVAAGSTEAVNGSQLNDTNTNVSTLGTTVGGIDARVTQNTNDITTANTNVTNLTTNVQSIDGRVSTVEGSVTNITNELNAGTVGLVQQDAATKAITVAAATGGTSINVAGTDGDRTISGVKDGEADNDAVNIKQLKASGLVDSTTGETLNAVVYDSATKDVITLGGSGATAPVTLRNVAAGNVAAGSTDAVNGSQLNDTNTNVTNLDTTVGGIDARVTQNTNDITTANTNVTNLTTNVQSIDGRVSTVEGSVTNITNELIAGTVGLVQQDAATQAITVASDKGGTSINVAGTDGDRTITGVKDGEADNDAVNIKQLKASGLVDSTTGETLNAVVYDSAAKDVITLGGSGATAPVTLRNVAAGAVSATSTDAVNGSQLYAVSQRVDTHDSSITNIDGRVSNVESALQGVNTGSVGLVQQDPASGNITVAAGTGGQVVNVAGTAGDRTISGVAAGVADNDAVNMAQLKAAGLVDASGQAANAVIYDSSAKDKVTLGDAGTAVTVTNVADGQVASGSSDAVTGNQLFQTNQQVSDLNQAIANMEANGSSNIAIAPGSDEHATATGDGSVAVGGGSNADGDHSVSVGGNSQSSGNGSTAVGDSAHASGDQSIAVGSDSSASGNGSTAMGSGSNASGDGSTAVGSGSNASGNGSTAMGSGATATGNNSVAVGANSVADRDNTVSVGSAGHERQITNVAAGTERTDAANWGQVQDAVGGVKDWANQKFSNMNRSINRVGAMGAAYGQMAFSAQGLQTVNKVGVGVGLQGGQSAIAVGYSAQLKSNLNISFGGSASGSDVSVGAGMSLGW